MRTGRTSSTRSNAVTEVPPTHWDWQALLRPRSPSGRQDHFQVGRVPRDMPFDPLDYGITPNSLHSIEPLQLFLLEAVRHALADAGYLRSAVRPGTDLRHPRHRRRRQPAGRRLRLPHLSAAARHGARPGHQRRRGSQESRQAVASEWTEDTFPGILLNVAAGRVANRFNLGGPNYAIDAACGSSLAAVYACVRELETGHQRRRDRDGRRHGADAVRLHGVQQDARPVAAGPLPAVRRGRRRHRAQRRRRRVILKRLADAERDGDRIYAVIKGMGASSDGRDKGLTAPRAEGQLRALRRAYGQGRRFAGARRAGRSPRHRHRRRRPDRSAGARPGDAEKPAPSRQSCAVGSVKSMIGHTQVRRRHRGADQDGARPAPQDVCRRRWSRRRTPRVTSTMGRCISIPKLGHGFTAPLRRVARA